MKLTLKLEELMMFVLGMYLFSLLNISWWWFIGMLLVPDICMLGYIINTKAGAFFYNLFHHKGLAILVYLIGFYSRNEILMFIGIILFSHASLDRFLGYGLKYPDSFKNTHLGKIGN